MTLFEIFADLKLKIDAVAAALADSEAAVMAAKQASYDEGFANGKAEGAGPVEPVEPGSKIFDQAEVDAMIASAIAPLEAKIVELEASIEAKAEEAASVKVAALKAELLAKYEAQQVAETAEETGFADLLK